MNYQEEQNHLLQECQKLQVEYDLLKQYFDNNPKAKKGNFLSVTTNTYLLRKVAEQYDIFDYYSDSDEYLQFRILSKKLSRCKCRLNQSKTSRFIQDGVKFIGSIAP